MNASNDLYLCDHLGAVLDVCNFNPMSIGTKVKIAWQGHKERCVLPVTVFNGSLGVLKFMESPVTREHNACIISLVT